MEVSVVMPCLNEHETIATCVHTALNALAEAGIAGEVIVADNGSTDGSAGIAESLGARVVTVGERGYGAALLGGIRAARGRYVIMGDADASYDFAEVPRFVAELRQGATLVQGCRLPAGGGRVQPGAMPWLHRWLGNPLLSWMARRLFRTAIRDIYCGMRGFDRGLPDRLELRCTGMEFATEMIVKASLFHETVRELPITLWPDGRKSSRPHLRTFRDGWRTLRFFLIFSPRWLFWYSGWLAMLAGVAGYVAVAAGWSLGGERPGAALLVMASLVLQLGFQAAVFAVLTTTFAVQRGFRPRSRRIDRFFTLFTLERGAVAGVAMVALGFGTLLWTLSSGAPGGGGGFDFAARGGLLVPGATLVSLGVSVVLNSFLCSMLGLDQA